MKKKIALSILLSAGMLLAACSRPKEKPMGAVINEALAVA